MLPAPFYTEVPHDLGHDAAWLGRDVMQALLRLRRHPPTDSYPEPDHDHRTLPPPAVAPFTRETATQNARPTA